MNFDTSIPLLAKIPPPLHNTTFVTCQPILAPTSKLKNYQLLTIKTKISVTCSSPPAFPTIHFILESHLFSTIIWKALMLILTYILPTYTFLLCHQPIRTLRLFFISPFYLLHTNLYVHTIYYEYTVSYPTT